MDVFQWTVRVYYEDTDAGGLVYHANYLNFFERARTELLRTHGFEQDALRVQRQILFAVVAAQIHYLKPARFNDLLMMQTRVVKMTKAGILFQQTLHPASTLTTILCSAEVRIVCLHAQTFRPTRIPEDIRSEVMDD